MNFTTQDLALVVTMAGAIIFMSFAFPALGMADENTTANETDIPDLNLSSSQFDIAGEFPESPGTPTSGTLTYDASRPNPNGIEGVTLQTLDQRDADNVDDNSFIIEIQNTTDGFHAIALFTDGGDPVQTYVDEYDITNEGQEIFHENNSWNVRFEVDSLENYRQPNMTAAVDWEVNSAPQDSSGWGIFAPVGDIVGQLAYLGDIIFWFVEFVFELALTLLSILVEIATFVVGLLQWLIGTYTSIISGAGSWAGVVLTIPLLILTIQLAKLGFVLLSLLPTT